MQPSRFLSACLFRHFLESSQIDKVNRIERFYVKNKLRFELFKSIYITQQKCYAVDCLEAR